MKQFIATFMSVAIVLIMGGCTDAPEPKMPEQMYTQVGMWYVMKRVNTGMGYVEYPTYHVEGPADILTGEKEQIPVHRYISSVNYSKDFFIPINSVVTNVRYINDFIVFTIDGKTGAIENKRSYTHLSIEELGKRLFGSKAVDMSHFSQDEIRQVKAGYVKIGMSKEAILLCRGYPPAHQTPDLKADTWKYWEARFNSRLYYFENNRLTGFKD